MSSGNEPRRPPIRAERGVALITVLLVVALATAIATHMISRQNRLIHVSLNRFEQSQALQYALGGEEIARQMLHKDLEQGAVDHLKEAWAGVIEPFEYPEGEVRIQISDLQSCYNVNGLREPGTRSELLRRRLQQVLEQAAVDPMVLDRLQDFMDEDQTNRRLGAEDYEYLALDHPYRTSSRALVHKSELRLLKDIPLEAWKDVAPLMCVLPEPGTPVNVNTAPVEVLRSLGNGVSVEVAQVLVDLREAEGGFEDVDAFLRQWATRGGGTIDRAGLAVASRYFLVEVEARHQERFSRLASVLQRHPVGGGMRTLSREFGNFIVWRAADGQEPPAGATRQ